MKLERLGLNRAFGPAGLTLAGSNGLPFADGLLGGSCASRGSAPPPSPMQPLLPAPTPSPAPCPTPSHVTAHTKLSLHLAHFVPSQTEIAETLTVQPGQAHVFGAKELNMGGWQAVAPVLRVQVDGPSGKSHTLTPQVGAL